MRKLLSERSMHPDDMRVCGASHSEEIDELQNENMLRTRWVISKMRNHSWAAYDHRLAVLITPGLSLRQLRTKYWMASRLCPASPMRIACTSRRSTPEAHT